MGTIDKWGYTKTEQDRKRKEIILSIAHMCSMLSDCVFDSAIDIGDTDGWITKDIKAFNLFAVQGLTNKYDLPANIKELTLEDIEFDDQTPMDFDLVLSIDGMHEHNKRDKFIELINNSAVMFAIISNATELECADSINKIKHRQILEANYMYNEKEHKLRMYMVEGSEKLWNLSANL